MANRQKIKGMAIALPIFGTILLIPPLTQIFATNLQVFGIPLIVLYLFCIWVVLISASFFISRRIDDTEETTSNSSSSRDGESR